MDQLQIGKNILQLRHAANVTQTELADFLGVTKASVSKWETAQSFPDIMLLPKLATYFNVTVDELLGYSPQLSSEQILNIHKELTQLFVVPDVSKAISICENYVKQYYNCYPLLAKISSIYMNHLPLFEDEDKRKQMVKKTIQLCQRIIQESNQIHLKQEALVQLAHCYIILQQPEEALEVIGDQSSLIIPIESLRAYSYQMLNQFDEAQKTLQIAIYQHLIMTVQLLVALMSMPAKSPSYYEELHERTLKICDAFHLNKLHPNTAANVYYSGAIAFSQMQDKERAIKALKNFVSTITNHLLPLELKGDSFFYMLDEWLKEMLIPSHAPANEAIIHKSILESIENPAFNWLRDDADFKQLKYTLQKFIEKRS